MSGFSLAWEVPVVVDNVAKTDDREPDRLEFVFKKPSAGAISRIQMADRRRLTVGISLQGAGGEMQHVVQRRLKALDEAGADIAAGEVIEAFKGLASDTDDLFEAADQFLEKFEQRTVELASMISMLVTEIRDSKDYDNRLQMPWGGTWSKSDRARRADFAVAYLPLFKAAFAKLIGDGPSEEELEKPNGQDEAAGGTENEASTPA